VRFATLVGKCHRIRLGVPCVDGRTVAIVLETPGGGSRGPDDEPSHDRVAGGPCYLAAIVAMWATLVLRFETKHRADVVTTADPTELTATGSAANAAEAAQWVEAKYGRCSVAAFTDVEGAKSFLSAPDEGAAAAAIAARGALIAKRLPTTLASAIAGA